MHDFSLGIELANKLTKLASCLWILIYHHKQMSINHILLSWVKLFNGNKQNQEQELHITVSCTLKNVTCSPEMNTKMGKNFFLGFGNENKD